MGFFNIKGFSFGLSSSVITTLGLMIGLNSTTGSKLAVIGGILTIAIADSFSDALAIHVSEEAENHHTQKDIWISTVSTFISKFFFSITFLIPVLLFPLNTAIIIGIIWGLLIINMLNIYMAIDQKIMPWKIMLEHTLIAIIVIIISDYLGMAISFYFG